jgi:hypothetical protein
MPASGKMLKNKEQKANRAAGVGDADGRMPSRVKAVEVQGRCSICSSEIRMTKKNIEARAHFESRHPTSSFAVCFPGQFDPTVTPPELTDEEKIAAKAALAPPKKKSGGGDLSFLDASIGGKKK